MTLADGRYQCGIRAGSGRHRQGTNRRQNLQLVTASMTTFLTASQVRKPRLRHYLWYVMEGMSEEALRTMRIFSDLRQSGIIHLPLHLDSSHGLAVHKPL